MNFLNKLYIKLVRKLKHDIEQNPNTSNIIQLHAGYKIGERCLFKNADIGGKINIGERSKLIGGVKIRAFSEVNIGRFTSLNGPNTDIICRLNKVEIGSFTSIARGVNIQEFNHTIDGLSSFFLNSNVYGKDLNEDIESRGTIEIGSDVWIGAQCVILSGAKIGHGAVIAANSVVTGEIPPYAIAAGSPAKVIKYRFESELIEELLKSEWWNKGLDEIEEINRRLFKNS